MDVPFGVNLYAQDSWHEDGGIIGTREGLLALQAAIERALKGGNYAEVVFAGDGEGYTLNVACVDAATMERLPNPYMWEAARDRRYIRWLGGGNWQIGEDAE